MSERAGNDQPDETTTVFTEDATKAAQHETTQVVRQPGAGSSAPPWQRGQQSSEEQGGDHDSFRYGSVGTVVADQQTVAEQRPQNGLSSVPNPFLTPASSQHQQQPQSQGAPPLGPSASVPLGAPGAIPVGGPPAHGHGPGQPDGHHHPGPRPSARPSGPVRARIARAPRKASLQIRRFDPWSVLKLSLVLSVAMFLMWLVAVGVLYGVLDSMGVWDKLNGAYSDLASVNESGGSGGDALISAGRVFGVSAVVGVVNIVLFTAFATVSAFVYNVSADLAGGIEVTLSERD